MDKLRLPDFIGSTLHISLGDKRVLTGTLMAMDCQLNLLLDHVRETRLDDGNQRLLGLVSVPRATISSIKLDRDTLEHLCRLRQEFMRQVV
ncbi:hypothetical protein HG536_0G03490 [Torulaspora globosa]|uniref:Sm domain-containing protein n=1 Tax=Torulaspora globosa TaxID=48254 RepID=A0A7G3ZLV1_9SACH|nr:uncharacterized protein HG536_0G03490 [Torulaspora globosa]QLL34487.1 hypothetical protein HG536_0G03490 [Torulaspora globosa]